MTRLVQISDTHLMAHAGQGLYGMDPEKTLLSVLERLRAWQPHQLLVTGDLADQGDADAYRRLAGHLATMEVPVAVIPGNHDRLDILNRELAGSGIQVNGSLDLGAWRVNLLDSSIPGRNEGALSKTELDRLAGQLSEAPQAHHLVALHHHVLPVGSPWLDEQALHHADAFLRLLEEQRVPLVISGHVHQVQESRWGPTQFLTAPSTCSQAQPRSDRFIDDTLGPGFRWLELSDDGSWTTGVERLGQSGLELAPA